MKKIFFVFAMLLMSMSSALAEEFETFSFTDYPDGWETPEIITEHFIVSGAYADGDGLYIHEDESGYQNYLSIKAKNGEIITRVKFTVGYGKGVVETTAGIVRNNPVKRSDDDEIYDVNASSLKITGDADDYFQISKITVYYESGNNENNNGGSNENNNAFVMDEYVQTESFSIYGLTPHQGRKVTITGSGNGDGYEIANSNSVKITAGAHVKILKVDFVLRGNNGSPIESTAGDVEGSDKDWTINNVNSSSLSISNSGTGTVKIKSIKVYYVEMTEGEETISVASDLRETNFTMSCESVAVTGELRDDFGGMISHGKTVTITANSGVEISKVNLYLYQPSTQKPKSDYGVIEGSGTNWTVNNVNSSTLTLSHSGVSDNQVWIDKVTVYYKRKLAPTTIEVAAKKVDDACWTTFYSNASNYQAPEGTQVFKVNLSGTDITMTEIEDRIVTKGQGVVLKSTTEIITMTKTKTDEESSADYSDNSLKGTSVSITNPGNAYVLSYSQSKGVGFYKLSSTGTIGMNKAYLVYDGSANARSFFTFEETATGVEMNKIGCIEGDDKVYDLQGRRVANPSNGIYIVNGKKVIMNRH